MEGLLAVIVLAYVVVGAFVVAAGGWRTFHRHH
jgi:hypothetical protein